MKVCVISDSLTNEDPENWVAQLAAMSPDIDVTCEAHGGWTTNSYFKSKFHGVAFAAVPSGVDLFIVLIGSNNLFEDHGGSDASVREATEGVVRIVNRVSSDLPGAGILLAAPPTVVVENAVYRIKEPESRRIGQHTPRYLARLSESYRRLAADRGWHFVDLFPVLAAEDFLDAAHPSGCGHKKIADEFNRALRALHMGRERNKREVPIGRQVGGTLR